MTTIARPTQAIFFSTFNQFLEKTQNLEATVLLAKLQFHCKNSSIIRDGKIWITRTIKEIADWFSLSKSKVSSLLKTLEQVGLIFRKNFKYKGSKQVHVSVKDFSTGYVNFGMIKRATELCSSLKSSMIFLKILYHFQHSTIENDNRKWTTRSRQELATWAGISIRTIDTILSQLENKGLLLKRVYQWQGAPQVHFHVPEQAMQQLFDKNYPVEHSPLTLVDAEIHHTNPICPPEICRIDPAKNALPYIKDIKQIKKTNNTYQDWKGVAHSPTVSDISFNNQPTIEKSKELEETEKGREQVLTPQQARYLEGALRNLVNRDGSKVSNPRELLEQLKFSIAFWVSSQKLSFKHAVNRAFAIIRTGNWRTPLGFAVYSAEGQRYHAEVINRERAEQIKAKREFSVGTDSPEIPYDTGIAARLLQAEAHAKTEKALNIASQLVKLEQSSKLHNQPAATVLIDTLLHRLKELFQIGADKRAVVDFMRRQAAQVF